MSTSPTLKQLKAEQITPENFQRYGQVIFPTDDHKEFDQTDAQLNLENGIPRLYIMQLNKRGLKFHSIARHVKCTQCLGALEGKDWYMAVCPANNNSDKPNLAEMSAFHIPGNCFIKLSEGTWHAGPYFIHDIVNFYNLELSNTNIVDFFAYDFLKNDQLEFEMVAI